MHGSPYQDPLFWPVQVSEQLCNASPQKPRRGAENGPHSPYSPVWRCADPGQLGWASSAELSSVSMTEGCPETGRRGAVGAPTRMKPEQQCGG